MNAESYRGTQSASGRIIVIGGGIAGLSAAVRLAQGGFPVTVLEAGRLGEGASMRNQGWLHSGAWFAPDRPDLAQMCYDAFQQTVRFCPECLSKGSKEMLYIISKSETDPARWTEAWDHTGIPFESVAPEQLFERIPGLAISSVQQAFQLPDCSIQVDLLLRRLVQSAEKAGVEIRFGSPVASLLYEGHRVQGIQIGTGEKIAARLVILAGNARGGSLQPDFGTQGVGEMAETALVALKTHLVGVRPMVSQWPLCVVDADGLNHLPHEPVSIFGTNRWLKVSNSEDQHMVPDEIERIWQQMRRFFPDIESSPRKIVEWAGTTVQAMHVDDLQAAQFPLPMVIDHQQECHQIENLVSIFPGRATLWAPLAETTHEVVRAKLGIPFREIAKPPWTSLQYLNRQRGQL